jgi:hypothetical protein
LQGVTTSTTTTTIYERLDTDVSADSLAGQDSESKFRLPALFWAVAILSAVNVLILFCIWLSPELRVNMYGEERSHTSAYFRPSPFTERVPLKVATKAKQPDKVRPVFYQEPEYQFTETADLLLPRSTVKAMAAATVTASHALYETGGSPAPERVHKIVDSYSDFPRMTASLATSRVTEPAHVGTVEVAPRRVSERAATHVTIER